MSRSTRAPLHHVPEMRAPVTDLYRFTATDDPRGPEDVTGPAEGRVLTCQAVPTSPSISVVYE